MGWLKPKHTPNPSWTAVVLAIALALLTANPATVIHTNTVKKADLLAVNPSIAVLTEGEIPSAKCLVPACDDTISMTIDKYGL